ncbi:uncharacterized protein LOC26527879 isoform X1 [Drosophila mojavensis]|uniref:uncharacterized protein LOC26527879 isoform X1 n=2 Tax=Drosophila mojavensis TaxID=7230 RepID=UPI0013EE6502|nr:uncharacterized protein LOC26527879 isoform X1 [Drosophila mojavensis]
MICIHNEKIFNAKRFCGCFSLHVGWLFAAAMTFIYCFISGIVIWLIHINKYPHEQGSRADLLYFALHLVPEVIVGISPVFLYVHELTVKKVCILIYVFTAGPHMIYYTLLFLITLGMGTNMIVNETGSYVHLFWIFLVVRFATTSYFIYIIISHHNQVRKRDIRLSVIN